MKSFKHANFDAIEISMPDIVQFAQAQVDADVEEGDIEALLEASKYIKSASETIGLKIMMLQPFARFEGWDSTRREAAFARAADWLKIMEVLGTDMLQVGSSDADDISHNRDLIVKDLAQLAQLCSEKGCKVAYENWCWSTHAPKWSDVWDIVEKANQPNLGLCLDTFQAAGAEYADPCSPTGYIESLDRDTLDRNWRRSLSELSKAIPAEKIYVLQISDAYKMSPPLGKDEGRAQWSHENRPLPCDGGYLPVQDVLNAVLGTGFRGYLSVEVFYPKEEKRVSNEEYVVAAMVALEKLVAMAE
ncbi:hypothetical protein PWT90_06348 [Aphanocladium album]|nr:hypothetical protein PWT90_06348 [Aphanocladium album]